MMVIFSTIINCESVAYRPFQPEECSALNTRDHSREQKPKADLLEVSSNNSWRSKTKKNRKNVGGTTRRTPNNSSGAFLFI